jgi:hypothetical protein
MAGIGAMATVTGVLGWRLAKERGFELPYRSAETPSGPQPDDLPRAAKAPPSLPERDAFIPHLRSEFQIREESGRSLRLILVEVGEVELMKGHLGTFASYSLLFEGHPGFSGLSRTCLLEHPQLGSLELFLSAVGEVKQKCRLQAVFSQRVV